MREGEREGERERERERETCSMAPSGANYLLKHPLRREETETETETARP